MTYPTIALSAAFTTGPYDPAPSWTDITTRLVSFETMTGRQQALDIFQPGTLRVVLDNSDRKFDPDYAAGPYFGNLTANKRLRFTASHNGTPHDVFYGFADDWPQVYTPGFDNRITLPATDGFKFLSRKKLARSAYGYDTASAGAVAWYPLGDTVGTSLVAYQAGELAPGLFGSCSVDTSTITTAGITPGDLPNPALGDSTQWTASLPVPVDTTYAAAINGFEITVKCATSVLLGTIITTPDFAVSLAIGSGSLLWRFGGFSCSSTGGAILDDFKPHHIFVTADLATSTLKIYIDGIDRSGATTGVADPSFASTVLLRRTGVANTFAIQNLAYWPSYGTTPCPNPTQIAARAALWAAPWAGDTTGERVIRYLDIAGWGADRNIDTGASVLGGAINVEGRTVLELSQQIETTEQGAFYVDHLDTGKVRFRDRNTTLTSAASTVSQATFTDDPAAGSSAVRYTGLDFQRSEQLIINEVVVRWDGGTVIVADATSQQTYGVNTASVNSVCATADAATNLGQWVLGHCKNLIRRIKALTVVPSAMSGAAQTAAYAQCLGRKIGDRVTVTVTPQGIGPAISIDLLIEGVAHKGDRVNWSTTFWLSQAETRTYWRLGSSALSSTTDPTPPTTTRLGY